MDVRRHLPSLLVTLGAVVAVLGSFRPWVASGSAERSSYELLGIAERLGVAGTGWSWWVIALWPLMPLALAVAMVASW